MTITSCTCGHLPAEHLIAADSSGPYVYQCEAWLSPDRLCDCRHFSPPPALDADIDAELPWRAA